MFCSGSNTSNNAEDGSPRWSFPTLSISSKIKTGLEEAERLNKKYKTLIEENDKFYFLYRNRVWNAGEKSFLGKKRKRGLLCQFNDFIVNGVNFFRVNTIANEEKDISLNQESFYTVTHRYNYDNAYKNYRDTMLKWNLEE